MQIYKNSDELRLVGGAHPTRYLRPPSVLHPILEETSLKAPKIRGWGHIQECQLSNIALNR